MCVCLCVHMRAHVEFNFESNFGIPVLNHTKSIVM